MKTKMRVMILVGIMLVALVLGMTGTVNMIDGSVNDPSMPMDCLIGVFVTKDYLDLYEGFDPTDDDEVGESENATDTARLYATIVETPFTNKGTGETSVVKQYAFEGIEGMRFLFPKMQSASDSYRGQTVDDAFSDVHFHVHETDESESILLKGTIYITSDVNFDALYFNPVYQSDAGEVYVVNGDAVVAVDGFIPGTSMSTKLNATRTKTIGDSEVSETAEVEVTVSYIEKPVSIAILQFDGNDQLLSRDEYAPETLPETLTMRPGAQYVVVETKTAFEDSSSSVMREIFQRSDEILEAFFFCRDDGLCMKQSCDVEWND